jgi:hypothetical protein
MFNRHGSPGHASPSAWAARRAHFHPHPSLSSPSWLKQAFNQIRPGCAERRAHPRSLPSKQAVSLYHTGHTPGACRSTGSCARPACFRARSAGTACGRLPRGPHLRARARPGGPGGARPRCDARRRGAARPADWRPAAPRPPPAPPACRPCAAAPCVCVCNDGDADRFTPELEQRAPTRSTARRAPASARAGSPPHGHARALRLSLRASTTVWLPSICLAFINRTKAQLALGPVPPRMHATLCRRSA